MFSVLTPIGLLFLIALVGCLAISPRSLVWLLSLAVPFSHTAMVVVGSNGLSPFWCVALVAIGRLAYLQARAIFAKSSPRRAQRKVLPHLTGATLSLGLFAAYAVVITVAGPALFHGVGVITPRGGLDSQIDNLTPLTYTTSNVAQLAYVIVGVLLVLYLVAEPPRTIRVVEAGIIAGFVITLFKHFLPAAWPQAWFDSNPSYYYHWIFEGARERGPFAEPSLLGMFLGMSLAYIVAAFWRARLWSRVLYVALVAIGIYLYSVSYTGTALLALGSVAGLAVVYGVWRVVRYSTRKTRITLASVAVLLTLVVIFFRETFSKYSLDIVIEKLGSDSFANRNASNANAFEVMLQSFGLGVGLGSDRPSSLFFMLISCVGVVGTLLFLRAALGYLFFGLASNSVSPVAWALLAQLIAQLVAKPDISMPGLWLLMGIIAATYAHERPVPTRTNSEPATTSTGRVRSLFRLP